MDAWRQFVALTDTATQIREAQRTISLTLTNAQGQHRDTFGAVRNYAELFPEWYYAQRRIPVGIVNGEPIYPNPPWDENTATGLWEYAVRHHEVDLWVPTDQETQATYTAAVTAARQIENALAREDQGVPLTADERDRLEQYYLTSEGVGR